MENAVNKLKAKVNRHLEKINKHEVIKYNLENECKLLDEDNPRKAKLEKQLLITLKSIEYHTITAKTYNKAIELIQE